MKYIKKINNNNYVNYRFSNNYVTPNVIKVNDNVKIHPLGEDYYKNKHFTITALNDNSILKFEKYFQYGISLQLYKSWPESCYIKFSRDNGKTWIVVPREYNSNYWDNEYYEDEDENTIYLKISFNMNAGDSIMFSINSASRSGYKDIETGEYSGTPEIMKFDDSDPWAGTFNCWDYANNKLGENMSFSVSGNIMSLFFGDHFNNLNEDDLYILNNYLVKEDTCCVRYLFYGINIASVKNLIIPYPIGLNWMFLDEIPDAPKLTSLTVSKWCYGEIWWSGNVKDIYLYALCTPEELYWALYSYTDDSQKFWYENMPESGVTLHKHPNMVIPRTIEINGEEKTLIPEGWTIVDID